MWVEIEKQRQLQEKRSVQAILDIQAEGRAYIERLAARAAKRGGKKGKKGKKKKWSVNVFLN